MLSSMLKPSNSSRGMSLVELMLVMAILSVVMMAVMSLYIPAHQSTVAQTQVSDVQQNLRLAMNTMTRDLMTAGFLSSRFPIVFPDAQDTSDNVNVTAENLLNIGTENSSEFIIRTRSVGSGFARIKEAPNVSTLTVHDAAMLQRFNDGSKVRIFEPMEGGEIAGSTVFTVTGITGTTLTLSPNLPDPGVLKEAVVVRVIDDTQPVLQTIRYRLNAEGGLERVVNGVPQILARNLSAVDFDYNYTTQGRVNRVDIKLTGQTNAIKDDAISRAKTREVATSVRLRNVF